MEDSKMVINGNFFFHLKSYLSSFPYVKAKPIRNHLNDESLKTSLSEFQRYKRLSVTDGSLTDETFQALDEELSSVQINFLTLYQPDLKPLFAAQPKPGFLSFSNLEFSTVTLDTNIVYDENQYTLDQARSAVAATVGDLQNDTYSAINVEFKITYSAGKGDNSYKNDNGVYGRMLKGAENKKVNILLFANNKYAGKSGSLYNPATEQIFVWEGSMAETPSAKNAASSLSSGAIAHEMAHLFFHYAGLSMDETLANNVAQDAGIIYALNQMRYNPFFIADPELPDDFDYKKTGGGIAYTPPRKSKSNPTYEQLLRIGAKRVAAHLK